MANKRVADIIARTYFSNENAAKEVDNKLSTAHTNYVNPNLFLLGLNFVLIVTLILGWKMGVLFQSNTRLAKNELKIDLKRMPAHISFDFTKSEPTTIEYSFDLGGADVSSYKAIAFDIRFNKGKDHSIRVRFSNGFNEIGEVGIPSLGREWKKVVIYLKDVPGISSWNDVKKITFILDKWNVSVKKGIMYVDNLRFIEGT